MKTALNRIMFALLMAIIASANISHTGLAMRSSTLPDPPLCPMAGDTPLSTLFTDHMEIGDTGTSLIRDFGVPIKVPPYTSNWGMTIPDDLDPPVPPDAEQPYEVAPISGARSLIGPGDINSNDSWAAMNGDIALPANTFSFLYFHHQFAFEYSTPANDGGVLEYSTNASDADATWLDARPLFSAGQDYVSIITEGLPGLQNPLHERLAFTGSSNGVVVASRYNLSSLAGLNVRFRWRMGTDYTNPSTWLVDDVSIYTCPRGAVAGVYDDTDTNWWSYSGSWTAYAGGGPSDNTMRYTSTVGAAASFTFSGTQFILTYSQATNRGNIDVYVDGSKVGTINAYSATMLWQNKYISPVFSPRTHVVQFKHAGGGTYIDVDAIQILNGALPGVNTYEDTDANWSYSGSWTAYTGAGPSGNNMRYTSTVGAAASFTFSGTQFILTYTQAVNRGNIDVYVDGNKVSTINANGAMQWGKTYTSPVYPDGTHIVQFRHAGGGAYIDVDAIQILATAASGAGVYEDTDANWSYSGSWTAYTGAGPSGNNMRYTSTVGAAASFTFSGTQFILTYTQGVNRGNIDVYVDGNKVSTINANGAMQWGKTYTSPVYPDGTHVAQFKHAGVGAYIDVDAIQILATAAPGVGTYDDTDANWFYTGSWTAYSGYGPSNSTMHYTSTVGDAASFTFSGTQFILTYTQAVNRGNIDVYVDGNKVSTINANGAMQWGKTYTSPVYPDGTHVVRFKHAGVGACIDVDAIQILATAAPGVGTYDDTDANWFYTGSWTAYSGYGPSNSTMHYTSTVGDAASFTFSGTQFILTYTQAVNRGNIDVYVDGNKVSTINANGAMQWGKTYTSPVYPDGTHVAQFKHAGVGACIDVDAIQILATAAPGVGTYDDTDANWFYTGSWTAYSGDGPSNSTMHYTSTVGDAASFTFSGTQFILTYAQAVNRGNIDVYVDGNKVSTINANGAMQWQNTFTSPIYPDETHVVRFKHAGVGAYIDVDAIQILP